MIIIDPASPIPPYEQLRQQIVDAVEAGRMPVGERLPTVRKLAADLELAPGTVAKAYRELETEGVIETHGRKGTFIKAHGDVRTQQAQTAAAEFAERITALRIDPAVALDLVRRALHA